jgi:alpha-glucosidase
MKSNTEVHNKMMSIKKVLFSITVCFLTISVLGANKEVETKSPSKNIQVTFTQKQSGVILDLRKSNQSIIKITVGHFLFDENIQFQANSISDVKKSSTNEKWSPVFGERNLIKNNYNELDLTLNDKVDPNKTMRLICRVYDEGVAFKYLFNENISADLTLKKELTNFIFDGDYQSWVTAQSQGEYSKKKLSQINSVCERPLVIKQNESSYMALGEAALVDYARMKFSLVKTKSITLQTTLDGEVDLGKAHYKTPWRYVMVADNPGELLQNNYFIQNLNEPNKIEDTSWIKPGKVIREVTLTTKGGKACIDFAAEHNLQYIEFDAGWYGNEYDDKSDASTITIDPKRSPGPLDLHGVIEYGKQKGIGIILYVNRRAMKKQLDEILPLYQSWGIKGLKYGFVNVGPQEWTTWLHEAIRKAADHKLMIDIHDDYRPTGYSRTYPNLMTMEGIRGDEESPSTEHSLTTLFTRMIAGAGDNTNCYLAPRVVDKMGGKTAQMAKAILLYSPWQFLYWYDRPTGSPQKKGGAGSAMGILTEKENLEFYDTLPTVWDESKILEGEIGEFATIARKSGENWFIGSLVTNQGRQVNIPLTFLDKKENYEAQIFFQNKEDLKLNRVSTIKTRVNIKSVLSHKLLTNSGFTVLIKKIQK